MADIAALIERLDGWAFTLARGYVTAPEREEVAAALREAAVALAALVTQYDELLSVLRQANKTCERRGERMRKAEAALARACGVLARIERNAENNDDEFTRMLARGALVEMGRHD